MQDCDILLLETSLWKSRVVLIGLAAAAVLGVFLLNFTLLASESGGSNSLSSTPNTIKISGGQPDAMSGFRAIFVTVPSAEIGKKLAHGLVSKKLAACVNIIPQITSVYEWEGKIEEDTEQLLMIKSQAQHFEDIKNFVKENHPYTVPEVIAVPIEQGSQEYLDWIRKVTKPGDGAKQEA